MIRNKSIDLKLLLDFAIMYRELRVIPGVSWKMLKIKVFLVPANGRVHLRIALLHNFPCRETTTFKLEDEWTKCCQNYIPNIMHSNTTILFIPIQPTYIKYLLNTKHYFGHKRCIKSHILMS